MIKRVVLICLLVVTLATATLFSATTPTIAQDDQLVGGSESCASLA